MAGGEEAGLTTRPITYCMVPRHLAARLHEPLRRHFADDPTFEIVVEHRSAERRGSGARRSTEHDVSEDRRRIRNCEGRRIAERRAPQLSSAARELSPADLPRKARAHVGQLRLVERLEPSSQQLEDSDTARLITRIQAGDGDGFAVLYMRYFDRVYTYLRVTLRSDHQAEDAAQQVFLQVLQALDRYEHRGSFWAWLATIVRNRALNDLRQRGRLELEDSLSVNRRRERAEPEPDAEPVALGWIGDRDIVLLVERLPLAQRQVLLLRYVLDLSNHEIAGVLDRTPSDVSLLHHRALSFIRARLAAVGRTPSGGRPVQWRRQRGKAPVLRARRFALLG